MIVSLKKIPSTSFAICLTNEKTEFFYNFKTKESTWDIPEEIIDVIGDLLATEEEALMQQPVKVVETVLEPELEPVVETMIEKKETCTQEQKERFLQLLSDRQISPYSSWDLISVELSNHSDYLGGKHGKKVFEEYCSSQPKPSLPRVDKQDFLQLLQQVKSSRVRWQDFVRQYNRDKRYIGYKGTDKQMLFTQRIQQLKLFEAKGRQSK